MKSVESPPILSVEDNSAHAKLIKRAFDRLPTPYALVQLADGESAMDYLLHRRQFSDARLSPRPALILLDLSMPKVHGLNVLEELKSHRDLKAIPVVIFTSSSAESDITRAYEMGANAYVVKPCEGMGIVEAVSQIISYWLEQEDHKGCAFDALASHRMGEEDHGRA